MPRDETDLVTRHFRDHEAAAVRCLAELRPRILDSGNLIADALAGGRTLFAFGNGGSASQASHLAGELLGRYSLQPRRPLAAVALASDPSVTTCIANDFDFGAIFERQLEALARPGDIALGLTSSGRSLNVLRGLTAARTSGVVTVALTGAAGLSGVEVGHALAVPTASTAHIQELHLMILHIWCEMIDQRCAPTA